MHKLYKLWYDKPAPNRGIPPDDEKGKDPDWEEWSLPLGGGHFGVNIFGRTDTERMQVTEVSLANPYPHGVNNFAEVYLDFGHDEGSVSEYYRDLVLNDATAHVKYNFQGISYEREYLTSYPDGVLAVKLTASEKGSLSFTLRAQTPYLKPFGTNGTSGRGIENNIGKTGVVEAKGNTITLSGEMEHYGISYEGQIQVIAQGGKLQAVDGSIKIEAADSVVVLLAAGTNYILDERTYLEEDRLKKLAGNEHPHKKVTDTILKAAALGYEVIRQRHIADYRAFFDRMQLDLGGSLSDKPTDRLLEDYKAGTLDRYLEELYFQYGRYLLIASSRKGTLPGNLQGLWNQYDSSPWSAGYWHNINIQMNYWPAFTTNLAEMFESYVAMNKAFRKLTYRFADNYLAHIRMEYPDVDYVIPMDQPGTGKNGWAIGTGGMPYTIHKPWPGGHSGPATNALTAKLFWDYYDYTRDADILKETVYPVLSGAADFLSKTLIKKDGLLLAHPSSSPEQCIDNVYPNYYQTSGCAFDQQMIYENHKDLIAAAEILGIDDAIVRIVKEQIDKLDPVIIGEDGQIKEYREERHYGEIGDPHHRHISHLKGLLPGQTINSSRPEWLQAAKVTLTMRGDKSTGWAMAFRLLCWARAQDSAGAYRMFKTLLQTGTLTNLWDTHPPFQIDGNYGGTAGVAEMLLQSNGNIIEPLPALPAEWPSGSFNGLVARGNVVIGCEWENGRLRTMTLSPRAGGTFRIKYPGIGTARVSTQDGGGAGAQADGGDLVISMEKGAVYTIKFAL
ncbi:MAG: glycoside hydrolase family 95 protein [Treponema sp.]|nr:glycoside hydrolase family 95 protein [Treponema sp.]